MPIRLRLTLLIALSLSGLFLVSRQVEAERLESNSYVIQFGNFNVTSGEKDSSSYHVTDTVGQVGSGPYGQYGSSTYFVGGGFQYIYQIDDFAFSISQTAIDLGVLTPNVHNTASHNLTVTTRGAGGYNVYAYELHPLRHSGGTYTIPDTTCDAGTCTQVAAGVWTNTAIPGFGYNMTGQDINPNFTNSTYFKQFADNNASEAMQSVMSSANVGTNRTATVTYKAGVNGSQAAGNYQTGIVFIAVPGY